MFSSRLPAALSANAISRAAAALRARRVAVFDLTQTNPTLVRLPYPAGVLAPLADPAGETYRPEPLGLPSAREAVAAEYGACGAPVDAERIVMTSSTSEAYALLFKLIGDAGDEVLVPQPSYPLFESLTALDALSAAPYRLEYHGAWEINRASLLAAVTSRTRAVLVVSPNNPTGSMLRASDRDWLAAFAADRDLAIISDEVFAGYRLRPAADAASFVGESRALTFALGGLSKSAGLPQVKLGWIAVSGPPGQVSAALARLEVICDTYLSVSTPVQVAAPALIASGREIRTAIQARITRNLSELERRVAEDSPVSVMAPEGGWSVVLRVPATTSEETMVLRLIEEAHVLVHPGFFFDFPSEAYLVLSLLPEPAIFDEAIDRILALAAGGEGRAE